MVLGLLFVLVKSLLQLLVRRCTAHLWQRLEYLLFRKIDVRLREEGRFLTGAIYVVGRESSVSAEMVEAAEAQLLDLHWRIHDISIMPRCKIEETFTVDGDHDGPLPLRSGAMRRAAR